MTYLSLDGRELKDFGHSAIAMPDTANQTYTSAITISPEVLNFLISEVSLIQPYWQYARRGDTDTALAWSNVLYSLLEVQALVNQMIETETTSSPDSNFHLTATTQNDGSVLLDLQVPPVIQDVTNNYYSNVIQGGSGSTVQNADNSIEICLARPILIAKAQAQDLVNGVLSSPNQAVKIDADLRGAIESYFKLLNPNFVSSDIKMLRFAVYASFMGSLGITIPPKKDSNGNPIGDATQITATDFINIPPQIHNGGQQYLFPPTGTFEFPPIEVPSPVRDSGTVWKDSDVTVEPVDPSTAIQFSVNGWTDDGSFLSNSADTAVRLYLTCFKLNNVSTGFVTWTWNYTNTYNINYPTAEIPDNEANAVTKIFNTGTAIGRASNGNGGFIYPLTYPNSWEFEGNAPITFTNIKLEYFIDSSDSGTTAFFLFANADGTGRLAPEVDVPISVGAQHGTYNIVPTQPVLFNTPIHINWSPISKGNNWPIYAIKFTFS